MERKCELCHARAALYCASDEAYICWKCDSNVHGANFLVARHYRSLLCLRCSSPTQWRASGASFLPTTCLCHPCLSATLASSGSDKPGKENLSSSAVSASQDVRRCDCGNENQESNNMGFSSSCRPKEKERKSSRISRSNKLMRISFGVVSSSDSRPRSPVSVISSARPFSKKRCTPDVGHYPTESSSASDSEDSCSTSDSLHAHYKRQSTDPSFTSTEAPSFSLSRRSRSLSRCHRAMPDRTRIFLVHQITALNGRQPCSGDSEATMERILRNWHDHLNLERPATVALAMHLFRRFCCAFKVSDRLNNRIILASCLWIAIRFHDPHSAECSSRLYEQYTGIPRQVLLAVEAHIYHLLNWGIGHEFCTDKIDT